MSDNAPTYVNLTLSLMAFYIMRSHSLRLLEVLHPDAQQSKNMVDAHFGIGGRQVDKYIRERDLGGITPDHIEEAFIYDGGIKGTAVDFVRVNRKSSRVLKWFAERDTKKNFDSIGKCGDIIFKEQHDGSVQVVTEKYSGGRSDRFVMKEFTIVSEGNVNRKIGGKKDGKKGAGREGEATTGHGNEECTQIFMGTDTGNVNTCREEDDVEIRDIADSIAGGPGNRRRRDHDEVKFSNRPPIGFTPYTGACIKFMSTINHWYRSVYLDCKEAFCDAQAEIEAEEAEATNSEHKGTEGTSEGSRRNRDGNSVSRAREPRTVPSDIRLEAMDRKRTCAVHTCNLCKRTFRRPEKLEEHEETCTGVNGSLQ